MAAKIEKLTWRAMLKFADGLPLTEREWQALSWLTLTDRGRIEFGPDSCRWATSAAERASNLAFYKSLRELAKESINTKH